MDYSIYKLLSNGSNLQMDERIEPMGIATRRDDCLILDTKTLTWKSCGRAQYKLFKPFLSVDPKQQLMLLGNADEKAPDQILSTLPH
jgi:hypothetical protein